MNVPVYCPECKRNIRVYIEKGQAYFPGHNKRIYKDTGKVVPHGEADLFSRNEDIVDCPKSHKPARVFLLKPPKRNNDGRFGFVCPEWAREHWNIEECTIVEHLDGTAEVFDQSIQMTIYVGHNAHECAYWLANPI